MKTLLIVEDDNVFLEFIKMAVQPYLKGHTILTAENGLVAKEVIKQHTIDLVLTDIMMPEMDGLALLAFINDRNYAIPCFVMSAFGTPEIKKLIPGDVLHFFSKPLSVDQLGPALANALEEGVPSGVVSGITVASFLLLVEMEKKTCLFEIDLNDGKKGICYFNKGVLFNAAFEGLRGEDAVMSLLQHEKAKFRFKPLPGKKFGKLVEKDLSTLINESRRHEQKNPSALDTAETVRVDFNDTLVANVVPKTKNKPTPHEHLLALEGTYQDHGGQMGGRLTVVDMNASHIIFEVAGDLQLSPGDSLRLHFILDDKRKSHIKKKVTVKKLAPPFVRCAFDNQSHYDRLGPYLHFNFLDKRSI